MEYIHISNVVTLDYPGIEVIRLPRFPLRRFGGSVAVRWKEFPKHAFWLHSKSDDEHETVGKCRFPQHTATPKGVNYQFGVVCACCDFRFETKAQLLVCAEFGEEIARVCEQHGVKTLFARRAEHAGCIVGKLADHLRWHEVKEFREEMTDRYSKDPQPSFQELFKLMEVDTR